MVVFLDHHIGQTAIWRHSSPNYNAPVFTNALFTMLENSAPQQPTFTVSQLNRRVKDLLEIHLPLLWVEGEISNLSTPGSGHWYFTLKDEAAQVSCAMFKRRNSLVKFKPKAGDFVRLRAHVSLYEGRGNYQLIVEHMEEAGFGILQRRFEELKTRLEAEGLFDEDSKQALPFPPKHLAVVTSPTGAAIRDVISVLKRRFPSMPITILPAQVQGDQAAEQITKQIEYADKSKEYDCILVCRGGGSIEDLWAFNNEALARAIYAAKTPIISAVGHEIDFTITDFVADVRAPTPSAAAELLSPDAHALALQFSSFENLLSKRVLHHLIRYNERVLYLRKRLKHPLDKVNQWQQSLDHVEARLTRAITAKLNRQLTRFESAQGALHRLSPAFNIKHYYEQSENLHARLLKAIQQQLINKKRSFSECTSQLHLVSPLATLERGYAIVRNNDDTIVKSVKNVKTDSDISITFSDGVAKAHINNVKPN